MNSLRDGSKYFVSSRNGAHCVDPFRVGSSACRHSKFVPKLSVCSPRCCWYHRFIASGSLHLKKTPPMAVARLGVDIAVSEDARCATELHPPSNVAVVMSRTGGTLGRITIIITNPRVRLRRQFRRVGIAHHFRVVARSGGW